MGEWSDDRSQLGWISAYEVDSPEMMKKSSRSGILCGSVGQYVGVPVDSIA